jgi:PAS domain S-box-containing protein
MMAQRHAIRKLRIKGRAPGRVRRSSARQSEELLTLAFEVGGIGVFETDLVRKRTRFSQELCRTLGLPPTNTELSYAEASGFIHKDDRAGIQANVEAAATREDRGKWNGICRVIRADGEVRWVSISGRRIYGHDAQGDRPLRSVGTVVDITHLRQAEAALQASERRLRLALDAAEMGTFEADINASEAHVDEQAARLLGLARGAQIVPVEQLRELVAPEDLRASDVKKARMTEHREAYRHEFRVRMPDGAERWLSTFADIRAGSIVGVSFDITPRKMAELAREISEDRLRTATAAAGLGIFEWDPVADRATWGNDRMYEIMGRTRAEGSINKRELLARYLYREDAYDFDEALMEAVRTHGEFHAVCRIRRADGSRRWLQIDGKFEQHPLSKRWRLVGVAADITPRKRLEKQTERLSQRLLTVQEEERRNIAQELHDSTVQHLVAANLFLAPLEKRLKGKESALGEAQKSLTEATRELRTFSYLVHPPIVNNPDFCQSLRRYVIGFAERTGLSCEFRVRRQTDRYPLRVRKVLFRIVQEGLANAYRHASATHVTVDLRRIGRRLHVIVADDGRGIGVPHALSHGVGLLGIRIRLRQLGGRLKIGRAPCGGTRLHTTLPV